MKLAILLIVNWFLVSPTFAQDYDQLDRQIQQAMQQNDTAKADRLIDKGLSWAKANLPADQQRYGSLLADKGAVAFRRRQYPEVIRWAKQAEIAFDQLAPDFVSVENLIRLSGALGETGDLPGSDIRLRKAEKQIGQLPAPERPILLSQVYRGYAFIYLILQNPEEAIRNYREAARLLKQEEAYDGYVRVLEEMILSLRRTHPDEALQLIEEIRDVVRTKLGGRFGNWSSLLETEAMILSKQGKAQLAEQRMKEALRAVAVEFRPQSVATASQLRSMGNFYQTVIYDPNQAEKYLTQAIDMMAAMGQPYHMVATHAREDLAYLYVKSGQYGKVAAPLKEAQAEAKQRHRLDFGLASEEQKQRYLTTEGWGFAITLPFASEVLKHQSDTLMQQLCYDATLYQSGLLLDEARKMRRAIRKRADPATLRAYDAWLAQRATTANAPLRQREAEAVILNQREEQLMRQLTATQPEPPAPEARSWRQIRASLRPTQAAVAFVRFRPFAGGRTVDADDFLYAALVVRPGDKHPRFVQLGVERQLQALLRESRTPGDLYGNRRGPDFDDITYGDSLYRFIWKPVDTLLRGTNEVFFSVEGLLNRVAFAALPLPGTTPETPVDRRYLSGRYTLRQLFSTWQVAEGIVPFRLALGEGGEASVVLMGGIDYSPDSNPTQHTTRSSETYLQSVIRQQRRPSFSPLRATGIEVQEIARRIPAATSQTNRIASEKAFRALSGQSPSVLHIATHGFYWPDSTNFSSRPGSADEALLRSGLALAGANIYWQPNAPAPPIASDGLLTAYEVADLDLSQTRLVVLSACHTALGDLRGSEGVFGLQRAFRLAGAEKLVISLWAVDDGRTQQFMNTFYAALKADSEVRDAFRQAQQALQKTDDPTLWAAFVLIE